MRTFTAIAVACIGTASALNQAEFDFSNWAQIFAKEYKTVAEWTHRFENWLETQRRISAINALPESTVVLGHNAFSDLTDAEYSAMLNFEPHPMNAVETILDTANTPDSINWVELGAVNPVQDQGQCGSCWAFSAIGSMEGQHFVQSGELLKLSEQQCVDCDKDSMGCGGGWQDNCMYYVMDNGGISLEKDYPYTAGTDACFSDYGGPVQVKSVHSVKSYSESQLLAAIAQGPVSVTVDADSTYYRNYKSGVITSTDCGSKLDHANVAVGYGTEDGNDYYLVRNSWGSGFGDGGYLKIGRNGDGYGICGIQEISVWATTN